MNPSGDHKQFHSSKVANSDMVKHRIDKAMVDQLLQQISLLQ